MFQKPFSANMKVICGDESELIGEKDCISSNYFLKKKNNIEDEDVTCTPPPGVSVSTEIKAIIAPSHDNNRRH